MEIVHLFLFLFNYYSIHFCDEYKMAYFNDQCCQNRSIKHIFCPYRQPAAKMANFENSSL